MISRVFWVMTPRFSLAGWYQRFVRTRFLHLQRQHTPPKRWQHSIIANTAATSHFDAIMLRYACAHYIKSTWRSGSIAPLIIKVDTRVIEVCGVSCLGRVVPREESTVLIE